MVRQSPIQPQPGLDLPARDAAKILRPDEVTRYLAARGVVGYTYVEFHYRRWAHLLQTVDDLVERRAGDAGAEELRILDIGESLHTELLRANHEAIPVDTLDIVDGGFERRPIDQHHQFDLNDFYFEDRHPRIGPYDVIVMAEVIEHLYTSAPVVMRGIGRLLRPGGYVFVQTPNAVALHKRIQMLVGRNPYMDIDRPRDDPPHFREYTIAELIEAGDAAGLQTLKVDAHNYFTRGTRLSQLYNALAERLPKTLRAGVSIVYAKP